jgi:hypothetical protein
VEYPIFLVLLPHKLELHCIVAPPAASPACGGSGGQLESGAAAREEEEEGLVAAAVLRAAVVIVGEAGCSRAATVARKGEEGMAAVGAGAAAAREGVD